jgi:hypothetical protein
MGIEIIAIWIGLGIAGSFGVSKGAEIYKHLETLDADRYSQCVKHADTVRECRGLE